MNYENNDEEINEEKDEDNIFSSVNVPEKYNLANPNVNDACLLSVMPRNCLPIKELPEDKFKDVYYHILHEPKCILCWSPHRQIAEHIYLDRGRRVAAVQNFFLEYFNARVTWECVNTHMTRHCDFSQIITPGLKKLENRADYNDRYRYKENELSITLLINEIDELGSLNPKNPELRLKLSEQLNKLQKSLLDAVKIRDEKMASGNINILSILQDIWSDMDCAACKKIVIDKVREIKKQLTGE
jgi:hypothetical protein